MTEQKRRRVVLLGATGSIGQQACDVIERYPAEFQLVGATAGSDDRALRDIAERFNIDRTAVDSEDAIADIAAMDADVVCVAIPGAAALRPALAAIDHGTDIALASKEVLVMAGEIVMQRASRRGVSIFPVDSEHSAIWQCLRGEDRASVRRLLLTASGGALRDHPIDTLDSVTVADALAHPTWSMGPKVTIDSASMMNKGLEIIEAHHLFGVPVGAIDVLMQPSSVVHSMVEFVDGSVVMQAGTPDMRVPIALALGRGVRIDGVVEPVSLPAASPLEFSAPDPARYPAIATARRAAETGGVAPAVMNAADEVAVEAFLAGELPFTRIISNVAAAIEASTEHFDSAKSVDLATILDADAWARTFTSTLITTGAGVA